MKTKLKIINPHVALVVAFGILLVFVMCGFILSLRPIADDYCLAADENLSLINYTKIWYTTWIGEPLSIWIFYFGLALPLRLLPFEFASGFSLVLTLSTLIFFVISKINISKSMHKIKLLLHVSVFVLSGWFSFWFLPAHYMKYADSRSLHSAIIQWQTINIGYVITYSIFAAILLKLINFESNQNNKLTYFLIAGMILGGMGYALALAAIAFLVLQYFALQFATNSDSIHKVRNLAVLIIGSLITLLAAYMSPGQNLRKKFFTSHIDFKSLPGLISDQTVDWVSFLDDLGPITALAFGLMLFVSLNYSFKLSKLNLHWSIPTNLLLLSFLTSVLVRISEGFAYPAWWHVIGTKTLIFYSFLFFGFKIGSILISNIDGNLYALMIICTGVSLVVGLNAVLESSQISENRVLDWEKGAGTDTYGGIADREVEWVRDCWMDLQHAKLN